MPAGARGVDTEGQLTAKANWISHNYTHLVEQPTVFYPVVIMLALMGDNSSLSVNLAWGYAGIRVLHSLWQANVNTIPVRLALLALSSAGERKQRKAHWNGVDVGLPQAG